MKTVPIPANKRFRKKPSYFDDLAAQLRQLPAGQALPMNASVSMRKNLHKSMEARGLDIRTASLPDGQIAVWLEESTNA
jgi:type II secretory pathway component PulM